MNIKHIILGLFAAAAVLVGCEPKEEDFGVAKIEVSTGELTFGPSSGSQTLQVTASREWTVSGLPDWIAVDPAGGLPSKGPQTVTVTVIANDGYNREADIAFSIGLMKEYVKVSQTGQKGEIDYGKGTLEHPFSIDGVISYINALDNPSTESPEKVYIKGVISSIEEEYTAQYGNGTFNISDDGSTSATQFKVYRAKYLGNKNFTSKDTQIKVGDQVIVYGNVVLYGSSAPVYETSQGSSYLYSLNGVTGNTTPAGDPKGNGSKDDPFNVAAALKVVEGLSWTSTDNYEKVGPFYVKGKISQIGKDNKTGEDLTYTQSGSYSNATFYISDDGSTDNEFYCYRVYYLGNKKYVAGQTDIKVGDEVIIYGELMNYRGNTPETVQSSAYLYSLNGDTGGGDTPPTPPAGDPKGTGTLDDPYNPAAAINAVKDLTWTDNSTFDATGDVYVKGKISRIMDKGTFTEGGTYGNASFYISEDGTSAGEFYCFRVLYLGNKKFEEGQTDIKVGDDVIIYGQLMNYKGNTPETVSGKAYLYSLNGDTGSGDTPPTPPSGDSKGTGTLADPYNAAGVIAYIKSIGDKESTDDIYVSGKISAIKYAFSVEYGTAQFDISDDGSTSSTQFKAYSVFYLGNRKWVEGDTQINVGDDVILCGKVTNYNGTYETSSQKAFIYSLNGKTDGGDTPPGPDVTPTDIASIIAADDDSSIAAENVYVGAVTTKGYVATDGKKSIYVYENATPTVKIGDIVKFTGTKTTYYGLPEITSPKTTKTSSGTVTYPDPVDITADFDKYTASEAVYVKYKAKMFKSGNYTNFKVDGAELTGALSSAPTAYYDGINEGDEVVIYGYYNGINTNSKLLNVIAVKIENLTTGKTIPAEGDNPGGETSGDFKSNLEWTLGASAYSEKATVNGTADVPVLKLGTSSKVGDATVTVPAGTKKITFYGVSWKGKATSVAFKVGGETVYKQALKANDGAANNSPYTLTVTSSDQYTYTLSSAPTSPMELTITTDGSNTRVIVFGIKAE